MNNTDIRTLYLMYLTFYGSTVNPPETVRNVARDSDPTPNKATPDTEHTSFPPDG